jgi:hypothetical protein
LKREQQIREIVETLIKQGRRINSYSREEIDKAIITCRGVDKRTRKTWFNILWSFEYLLQPQPNLYSLNMVKLAELDVKPPLSPKQTQLE